MNKYAIEVKPPARKELEALPDNVLSPASIMKLVSTSPVDVILFAVCRCDQVGLRSPNYESTVASVCGCSPLFGIAAVSRWAPSASDNQYTVAAMQTTAIEENAYM